MAIDWSLGRSPNIIGNALAAYDEGKKMRREDTARTSLGTLVNNPNDLAARQSLAQADPGTMMQFQTQQAAIGKQQREQKNTQTEQLGKLLNHAQDEGTYQQALSAAKQIGIDTTGAPPNFDPAWVNQQKAVLAAFDKDGGSQISGLARELQDAGYKPGTPEFQQAMGTALRGKYAPQYTDAEGNLRQSQLPPLPGMGGQQPAPQAPIQSQPVQGTPSGSPLSRPQAQAHQPRPAGLTNDQLMAQAYDAVKKGASYDAVFRQLQEWGVNP